MTARWIEANGVQLRYDLTTGPRLTVVLIHEMGGTLESWDDVVGPLSEFASVLRYDQRGVGLSEKVPGPVTIEQLAADLAGLLDALGIRQPVAVAGVAVGAAVAAAFAALYPSRIAALLMLAPATDLRGAKRVAALRRIEAIERAGVRAAFADAPSNAPARFAVLRLTSDPMGLCAIWRMLADLEMSHLFSRIACPTLVAAAMRDAARPPEHVSDVADRIPGARLIAIDTTHYMAIETPQLVERTIVGFLKDRGLG
ncbi:alpha/beta fold hydrolase [Arvimicrobium flavum]|uniref:alpha/beta fold hydrolase n=1 Tax=Arvimicrobium flavum TaxID=3393320 RepID=UPI00237B3F2D|nr:alpha/beta fold hydrolase [Mesorhizobium shangrilense]